MGGVRVIGNIVVAGLTTLLMLILYPKLVTYFITPMYNLYQTLIPDPRPEMTFWWKFLPIFILGVIIWRGVMLALGKMGWGDEDDVDVSSGSNED